MQVESGNRSLVRNLGFLVVRNWAVLVSVVVKIMEVVLGGVPHTSRKASGAPPGNWYP
jgi:hypothetical protein